MATQERIKWFSDLKFGMFLHFGPFALTGRCEWTYNLDDFTYEEYAELAAKFNPVNYDPKEWVKVAKEAGMKYMVLTTRHHDGYCLWDTKTHDYNSVKGTPKRDIVADYVKACREGGLGVGLYYSLVDWRYKCEWDGGKDEDSKNRMVQQAHDQVRELLTNYGKIDILWFDGMWVPKDGSAPDTWRSVELTDMCRKLQPDILMNDRAGITCDFGTPERTIQPEKGRAWESCLTMDPVSWSHVPYSPNRKTTANVVSDLASILCGGGNLLLNIGPKPDGTLLDVEVKTILEAGAWYKKYHEAFEDIAVSELDGYGSPFSAGGCQARWIATSDPKVQYAITRCWTGTEFWFARVGTEVESVELLPEHKKVDFHTNGHGRLILTGLPEETPDPYAAVFKVVFKDTPKMTSRPNEEKGTL